MKDTVLLKGNQHGLAVFMNENSTYEQIKNELIVKLEGARNFFGANKVTISLEGKKLTNQEQEYIVSLFHEHSDLEVLCVVDEEVDVNKIRQSIIDEVRQNVVDEVTKSVSTSFIADLEVYETKTKELESENRRLQEEIQRLQDPNATKIQLDKNDEVTFHYATLRSGQEVTNKHSVVILGDVNNGARVEAGGNVIILGKLKGVVHAGLNGTDNAYIVALDMKPVQLRINNAYGRASDEAINDSSSTEPQIAFIDNGMIAMENIDSKVLKEIRGN